VRHLLFPGIFGVAFALRALPFPTVFSERGLLPGTLADEFYHLRRIVYSAVNFPEVLSFDPYVGFPHGGSIPWPPGFDWAVAALARGLVGGDDPAGIETVAAWVPPLLGSLAAVLAALVAGAAFGRAAAATAGLLLAVLPAGWMFSRVGMVDHHVAVAVAGLALLGLAMAWLRTGARESPAPGPGLAVALGLALGVPLVLWPGFLLHIAVTQVALVAAALAAVDPARARRRARSLAGAHAVAAVVVLPFCLGTPGEQYGPWSPLVLSRFQPAWLGAGAAALALADRLWSHPGLGGSRPRRLLIATALGLLGIGTALLLAPGLRDALGYAGGWFTKAESFQTHVAELSPLTLDKAITRFSYAILAFPLAWAVVAIVALRERAMDRGLLLLWALGFGGLAFLQSRFANSFVIGFVLVWGGAAGHVVALLRDLGARRPPSAAWIAVAAGIAGAIFLTPVVRYHASQVRQSLATLERPEMALASARPSKRVQLGVAWWLARSTPSTRGYLDPSLRPEYGVLAPWGAGHLIRHVARRPVVQDNFGVYAGREGFERAAAYYSALDEGAALGILEDLGVRYVVADRGGAGIDPRAYDPRSMTHRLARLFGSAGWATEPATGQRVQVPALARHRLVYHARSGPGSALRAAPPDMSVAVFEIVPGARVEGTAAPGSIVEARLRITTRVGRHILPRAREPLIYLARTRADAQGRYALTLPYATDAPFSDSVRVAPSYLLRSRERSEPLVVSETDVRAGTALEGPSLSP